MGTLLGTAYSKKQILIVGLENAGKTALLCLNFLKLSYPEEFTTEPTLGYNLAEIDVGGTDVCIYDLGGKETCRLLWPTFYRKLYFQAMIFVIDAWDDEKLIDARKEIDRLSNEEELRNTVFCFLYNVKKGDIDSKGKDDAEHQKATEPGNDAVKDGQNNDDDKPKMHSEISKEKMPSDENELEDRKKYLDHSIGLDTMHTFKVRKSFIFNIMSKGHDEKIKEMNEWVMTKIANL
jgi:GTPase SAR1 family protein